MDSLDGENILWDHAFVAASCIDCTTFISSGLAVVAVLQGTETKIDKKLPAAQAFPNYLHS